MTIARNYRDYYAPFFLIEADGDLANDIARKITQFEYTDSDTKSDELKITVANPGHLFTDDIRFTKGVRFRTKWGYKNDISEVRDVIVSRVRPYFPPTGVPTMTLIAFDLKVLMNRGAKPKNWGKISSSAVARTIAIRYGLDVDIEDSGDSRKEARLQPASMSEVQYLTKLADALNYDFYIENGVLHFHPMRYNATPAFTFDYVGGSITPTILEFEPDVKMNRPNGTGATGLNPKTGKPNDKDAKPADKHGSPRGATGNFVIDQRTGKGQFRPATEDPRKPSAESQKSVTDKHALANAGKLDMKANEATVKVIGTPKLRARTMITLRGVGKTYSGVWRVKESRHIITPSGYTVHCKLTRNAAKTGTTKKKDKDNKGDGSGSPPPKMLVIDTFQGAFRHFGGNFGGGF